MMSTNMSNCVGPASAGHRPGRLKPTPRGVGLEAQRGAALFISLIALVAMSFAGLALLRSMDTAGLISGNFSFRQAALSVTDLGMEAAVNDLQPEPNSTIGYIANGPDNTQKKNASGSYASCTSDCTYYAWYYDAAYCTGTNCDNSSGVSQRISWDTTKIPGTDISFAALGAGYSYQYVIERLCDARQAGTVITPTNVSQYCFSMRLSTGGSCAKSGDPNCVSNAFNNSDEVAYRATIRVTGPHNASTMVQAIFLKKN